MRLVKNANHFTIGIDRFLNHIFNRNHSDTDILFYGEIAHHWSIHWVIIYGTW